MSVKQFVPDRSDTIKLVALTYTADAIGQQVATETEREVFCAVKSASRAEFFAAGEGGLVPEFTVTMFKYDYSSETIAQYGGRKFTVYRTYDIGGDMIELYLARKVGTS